MSELEEHLISALKTLQNEFEAQQVASLQALEASQTNLARLLRDYQALKTQLDALNGQVEALSGQVQTLSELLSA